MKSGTIVLTVCGAATVPMASAQEGLPPVLDPIVVSTGLGTCERGAPKREDWRELLAALAGGTWA